MSLFIPPVSMLRYMYSPLYITHCTGLLLPPGDRVSRSHNPGPSCRSVFRMYLTIHAKALSFYTGKLLFIPIGEIFP